MRDIALQAFCKKSKAQLRDNIISLLQNRATLSEKASIAERVTFKIMNFVGPFINRINR